MAGDQVTGVLTYEAAGWFVGVTLPIVGGLFLGWRWIAAGNRRVEEIARRELKEVTGKLEALQKEFAAYKLEAAQHYAAVGHLRDVEARLTNSIDKLTNRIDKLLTRLDRDP